MNDSGFQQFVRSMLMDTDFEIRKLYEKDARAFITPKLKELGFNTMNTQTPIIPVLLGCSR